MGTKNRAVTSAEYRQQAMMSGNPGGGAANHPTIAFSDEIQETLANTTSDQSIPDQQPAVSNRNCRGEWWGEIDTQYCVVPTLHLRIGVGSDVLERVLAQDGEEIANGE